MMVDDADCTLGVQDVMSDDDDVDCIVGVQDVMAYDADCIVGV